MESNTSKSITYYKNSLGSILGEKKKGNKNYVDSKQLEEHWMHWINTKDEFSWDFLLSGIYRMCYGIAIRFNPKSDEEHCELAHEAFYKTIEKIEDGRLTFEPGRAPVFNLLTTTIFRHLYSTKSKETRRRGILMKHREKLV